MADLTFEERHVMRVLLSSGGGKFVSSGNRPKHVLDSLVEKGLLEKSQGDRGPVYSLTFRGREVRLTELR